MERSEVIRRAEGVRDWLNKKKKPGILAVSGERVGLFWSVVLGGLEAGWAVAPVAQSGSRRQTVLEALEPDLILPTNKSLEPLVVQNKEGVKNYYINETKENKSGNKSSKGTLLMATSGTTGEPDLIEITPGNIEHHVVVARDRLKLSSKEVWFDPLPVHHMGGLMPLFRMWITGGRVVVPGSGGRWWSELNSSGATAISLVPTMLGDGLEAAPGVLRELRFVLCGGDRIPRKLIRGCRAELISLLPSYGLTETTSMVCVPAPDGPAPERGYAGPPLDGTAIRIEDPQGRMLEPGREGRIVVEGPVVAKGILGGERFTGRFPTSDRGRLDGKGNLYVTGRRADRIVSGGVTVEAGELEDSLRTLEGVRRVLVVGLESERWGQRPAGLFEYDGNPERLAGAVRAWNRQQDPAFRLERWKAVDELPYTATGKPDRNRAKDLLE